jgi:hypothetical protein
MVARIATGEIGEGGKKVKPQTTLAKEKGISKKQRKR